MSLVSGVILVSCDLDVCALDLIYFVTKLTTCISCNSSFDDSTWRRQDYAHTCIFCGYFIIQILHIIYTIMYVFVIQCSCNNFVLCSCVVYTKEDMANWSEGKNWILQKQFCIWLWSLIAVIWTFHLQTFHQQDYSSRN